MYSVLDIVHPLTMLPPQKKILVWEDWKIKVIGSLVTNEMQDSGMLLQNPRGCSNYGTLVVLLL